MRACNRLLAPGLLALLVLPTAGCIQYGALLHGWKEISGETTTELLTRDGSKVRVDLLNGQSIEGTLETAVDTPDDEYAASFAAARDTVPELADFPVPGDMVYTTQELPLTRLVHSSGEFLGFAGIPPHAMLIRARDGTSKAVDLRKLSRLATSDGRARTFRPVAEAEVYPRLPNLTRLRLGTDTGEVRVDAGEISGVYLNRKKEQKRAATMAIAGLVLTYPLLYLFGRAWERAWERAWGRAIGKMGTRE